MKKTNYLTPTVLLVATVAAMLLTPTITRGATDEAFARQIAGSYLVNVQALGLQVMLQISADGGTVRISSADAGAGRGAPFASRTPAFGNWHRTGDRNIQLVEMEFEFDAQGVPFPLPESGKAVVDLAFAEDWQSASGTVKALVYAPNADVLEDAPTQTIDLGTLEARKLR